VSEVEQHSWDHSWDLDSYPLKVVQSGYGVSPQLLLENLEGAKVKVAQKMKRMTLAKEALEERLQVPRKFPFWELLWGSLDSPGQALLRGNQHDSHRF